MWTTGLAIGADLVAIAVLARAVYFTRHRRRDLMLAYTALNLGVLAVSAVLTATHAGIGLGLGLFGILSIIRLRSSAITQEEVAYYFVALAIGVVCGIQPDPAWVAPAVAAALVLAMVVADHPRVAAGARQMTVTLDRAYADPEHARRALEQLLDVPVGRLEVLELDLVRDVTVVDVRCGTARQPAPALVPVAASVRAA